MRIGEFVEYQSAQWGPITCEIRAFHKTNEETLIVLKDMAGSTYRDHQEYITRYLELA